MGTEFVSWRPEYELGHEIIDGHHKTLVELINKLYVALTEFGHDRERAFTEAVRGAAKYAQMHFSTEEKLMVEASYPGYAGQKKQHAHFIHQLLEHAQNHKESAARFAPNHFVRFLRDWLLAHIALEDRQLADFLRSR
ncbi:MAG: hemerythrin family protein [Deltaproteobacteria bacterium]|nr:hemerythrin family protein [Deltaproteobacteria bacterium]